MKILVTGAAGRLASAIAAEFSPAHDVTALPRAALDITDRHAVDGAVGRHGPQVIINCAAYNDVDRAQRDPRPALEINALAVLGLARAANRAGARLVHYSTDFVFDGELGRPYRESDPARPLSFYGASKLLGERFAEDAPRHYVLRVESLFGGPPAKAESGSLGGIVGRLRRGEEVPVFGDRTVSPSYAPDVARATRKLIEADAEPGVYHCVNAGAATWDVIAREAASILGIEPALKPVTMDAVPLQAPRPRYCALDPSKIAAAGAPMRTWPEALREWLRGADGPDGRR